MNRPLKFRVWDKVKKQMFYPSNTIDWTIGIQGEVFWYCGTSVKVNVVVQQFTGLNDSKGNPIYEGDIIEQNFGEKPSRGLVKFSRGSFRVIWPAEPYDDLGCMLIEYVTVIGNVFENPKMRKVYE